MIREAVAAVFVHAKELFVIKRQSYLRAFPGYWAFPGGKVDREESWPVQLPEAFAAFPLKLIRALMREMREELDVDLVQLAEQETIKKVAHLGTALTPDFNPHRFRTHFFKIELTQKLPLQAHADEAEISGWFTPRSLISRFDQGELLVVPPMLTAFRRLAEDPAREIVEDLDFTYDAQTEVPCIECLKDVYQLAVRSHTAPPAKRTNAFVMDGLLIDPAPESEVEKQRLLKSLKPFQLRGIFLTHAHSDHWERADDIAAELKLPFWMSESCRKRLPNTFKNYEVTLVKQDDVVGKWLGEELVVHEVPGHDNSQLALAPRSLKWFLVGDLIQGIGSVVIKAPEGHMATYFETLKKILFLNPAIILPSHGAATGSTHLLKKVLKHRIQREKQIFELVQKKWSAEKICASLYFDASQEIRPFALANVKSHLQKLQEEGRLLIK